MSRKRSAALAVAVAIGALTMANAPALAADPTLAAAGDIACGSVNTPVAGQCHQQQTSDLVVGFAPTAVAMLGDAQYPSGSAADFGAFYAPTWGRFEATTFPVPGNHEYRTTGAAGYFGYFGARAGDPATGYYSYDLGDWHLVALNSNCAPAACDGSATGVSDAELTWLGDDLAAHPAACTLAYWHHPRFATGPNAEDAGMSPVWRLLDEHGVDLVLGGHIHHYERFAPQDADGVAEAAAPREFLVGTGGRSLSSPQAASRPTDEALAFTFGVLVLTLHPTGYHWRFADETGAVLDAGSAPCDPPLAVTGGATADETGAARLTATITPGTQPVAYRFEYGTPGGATSATPEASLPAGTDPVAVSADVKGLQPGTAYRYRVVARVPGGEVGGAEQSFTTPAAGVAVTPTPTATPTPMPTPTPAAPAPTASTAQPGHVRLRAAGRRAGRHGVVRLRVSCRTQAGRCAGVVALTARIGGHRIRIARRAFSIPAFASRTLRVRLSRRARRALAHRALRVTVSARPRPRGSWTAAPLRLRLLAPRI